MDHKKPLPDDIIGDVFMYGMLCDKGTAVAVPLWNKLWYCRIHMRVTQQEMVQCQVLLLS